MKHKLLLFGFVAALLTGCSTYKAGQTPDDVYFSPVRKGIAQKETKNTETYNERYSDRNNSIAREDDQYLRMKIRNRDRWSMIDDNDYWYDSRYVPLYDYNTYRNNWNSYTWNNWSPGYYNLSPYIGFGYGRNYYSYGAGYGNSYYPGGGGYFKGQSYITKRPPSVSRPSLSGYSNRNYNNNNLGNTILKAISPSSSNANSYSNSNNNNNTSNTYTAPERTYTPSSSSSSSGSSSSGSSGSGAVSRPARSGN